MLTESVRHRHSDTHLGTCCFSDIDFLGFKIRPCLDINLCVSFKLDLSGLYEFGSDVQKTKNIQITNVFENNLDI